MFASVPLIDEMFFFQMRSGIPVNSAWFQQDGAEPQATNAYSAFFLKFAMTESCRAGILLYLR
jgi:hypothetical protein